MNKLQPRTIATTALAVLLLLASSSGAQAQTDGNSIHDGAVLSGLLELDGDFTLPAGSAATVTDNLWVMADTIILDGELRIQPGTGDAPSVYLQARSFLKVTGSIYGADGADAPLTSGMRGMDGGRGSNIILEAPHIDLGEVGVLTSGNGGNGGIAQPGPMMSYEIAKGGNGGDAGYILALGIVDSAPDDPENHFGGGSGGDGAMAMQPPNGPGNLIGGNGGQGFSFLATDPNLVSFEVIMPEPKEVQLGKYVSVVRDLPIQIEFENAIVDEVVRTVVEAISMNPCDGGDGADQDASAPNPNNGKGADGAPGSGEIGIGIGGAGQNGAAGPAGPQGGTAVGGDGDDGCLWGSGGDGGDATANGNRGGHGGNGGAGQTSIFIGGAGGNGGSGGSGGGGGSATGGHPGCGGVWGVSGAPGTATATGGDGGNGGNGGQGGNGLVPGPNGSPGPQGAIGVKGTEKVQPSCVE